MKKSSNTYRAGVLGAGAVLAAICGQAIGQVQHGVVNVLENDATDTAAAITATRAGGYGLTFIHICSKFLESADIGGG